MSRREIDRRKRRIVGSVMGKEGAGKTAFCLTAPRPLLYLACDPNAEDVVSATFEVDDVEDLDPAVCRFVRVPYPLVGFESSEEEIMDEATDSWNLICDEISDVLHGRSNDPATVILDSGTELNTLNILKDFGRTDKISPNMRRSRMGKVNNDFKGIFRALEKAQTHVLVTHRCKSRWTTEEVRTPKGIETKDVEVPGVFDRIGFKEMGNIVNLELLMKFDPDRGGKLRNRFGVQVTRSMARPILVGTEWWGREEVDSTLMRATSFAFVGLQLYPTSTPQDWE